MRAISVSIDVFQRIWTLRRPGEHTEDEILRRVLGVDAAGDGPAAGPAAAKAPGAGAGRAGKGAKGRPSSAPKPDLFAEEPAAAPAPKKVRWVDDVAAALRLLGGAAELRDIYRVVRRIREQAGRPTGGSFEAIVRQTIETHSSDAQSFRGRADLFAREGRGRWRLR